MNPVTVNNAKKVICSIDNGIYDCTVTGDTVEKKMVSHVFIKNGIVANDPNIIDTPIYTGKDGVEIYFKLNAAKCTVREESIVCRKNK